MTKSITEVQISSRLSHWAKRSWMIRFTIRSFLLPVILFSTASLFSTAVDDNVVIRYDDLP